MGYYYEKSFSVSLQVSDGGISPVLGQSYELTCNSSAIVTGYQWMKDGEILMNERNEVLSFQVLTLSDSGLYTCQVVVQSVNYTANRIDLQSKLLPSNKIGLILNTNNYDSLVSVIKTIVLTSNTSNPIPPDGSDIMLTCTVEFYPEVNVSVMTIWDGPCDDNIVNNITEPDIDSCTGNLTSTALIRSFEREHSGYYTCSAIAIFFDPVTPYLNYSVDIMMSKEILITTGKY